LVEGALRSHAKSSCTRLRKHHVLCLWCCFPHDCRTSCQVGMELENQDMRCGLYVVCCPTPSPVAHPRQRVCLLRTLALFFARCTSSTVCVCSRPGSHWEQRLMNGELMAPMLTATVPVVSSVTLALFEDRCVLVCAHCLFSSRSPSRPLVPALASCTHPAHTAALGTAHVCSLALLRLPRCTLAAAGTPPTTPRPPGCNGACTGATSRAATSPRRSASPAPSRARAGRPTSAPQTRTATPRCATSTGGVAVVVLTGAQLHAGACWPDAVSAAPVVRTQRPLLATQLCDLHLPSVHFSPKIPRVSLHKHQGRHEE
jgi:hypothetical protein